MKTFNFLATQAKCFGDKFFLDFCNLLIGKKQFLRFDRYLVYPTYFSWLLDNSMNLVDNKDRLYAVHTGQFRDWFKDSPMWGFLHKQIEAVNNNKLQVKRLIILRKEDCKFLYLDDLVDPLFDMTLGGMEIYLSTETFFDSNSQDNNWAIYYHKDKSFLLKYEKYESKAYTQINLKKKEIRSKSSNFQNQINSNNTIFIIKESDSTKQKTQIKNAIKNLCVKSGWRPPRPRSKI